MGRNARFTSDQILAAALGLLSERGPEAVTMSDISRRIGAPIGSLYHRFPSRDHLMARLWLDIVDSFQRGFLDILQKGDGLAAALYATHWVREHFNEARVLLLFRREDLVAGEWPEEMRERAAALPRDLQNGFYRFVQEQFGRVTEETMGTAAFALINVPYAAARSYLERGKMPPPLVDRLIEKTYRTIMGGIDENMERS